MWSLLEYGSEFSDFLGQWDQKRQGKMMYCVNRLRNEGNLLRGGMVDHIEDGIYELIISQNKQEFRILFFYMSEKRIYFVVCFEKKTQKTPRDRIALALRRKNEIELDEALANAIPIH